MLTDASSRFFTDFNCFSLIKHEGRVYLASVTDCWCSSSFCACLFSAAAAAIKIWSSKCHQAEHCSQPHSRKIIHLPGKINSQQRVMDVIQFQMSLCYRLHLYQALLCGLLFCNNIRNSLFPMPQARLH